MDYAKSGSKLEEVEMLTPQGEERMVSLSLPVVKALTKSLFRQTGALKGMGLLTKTNTWDMIANKAKWMAADAGLVAEGETVVAIAGTARGSDTAMSMRAASSQHMRRIRVHEVIFKPLNPISIDEMMEAAKQGNEQGD